MRGPASRCARLLLVPIAALTIGGTTSCDVRLDASQVTIDLQGGGGILLVSVKNVPGAFSDHKEVPGGETVITIVNRDQHNAHRVMLAKVDASSAQALPPRLVQARFVSDDPDQILELSESIKRDELIASSGSFTETDPSTIFHDYLSAGQRYVLVDPGDPQHYFLLIEPRQDA